MPGTQVSKAPACFARPRSRPPQGQRGGTFLQAHRHRVADRRGKSVGKVATARKIVTLVFYGLRDGEIRCLAGAG